MGQRAVFVRPTTRQGQTLLQSLTSMPKPNLHSWVPTNLSTEALTTLLAAAPGTLVRSAPAHKPLLRRSAPEIEASLVHVGHQLDVPRRGTGVLIGVIDTGLDLYHPSFLDTHGVSRVVAAWDQDATSGRAPPAFGYGHLCEQPEIAAGTCDIGDPTGHGTHVVGIAAGGDNVGGVASLADIAVVRSAAFTRLGDAVTFLTRLADRRGQPVVVNISVGGQYGPHDGQTPLERYLSEISGPGRVFVAAAGNDGGIPIHLGVHLSDRPVRVALAGVPFGKPVRTVVEMWGEAHSATSSSPPTTLSPAVELWWPEQTDAPVAVAELSTNPSETAQADLIYGAIYYGAVTYSETWAQEHGRTQFGLVIDAEGAAELPEGATVALRLTGTGAIDGWVGQSSYRYGASRFADPPLGYDLEQGWVWGDSERSIAVPATARAILAVGAYAVGIAWTAATLEERPIAAGLFTGALAPYSSLGPTTAPHLTGLKPEITAPGSIIASAKALWVPKSTSVVDDTTMVMEGTSMAAPHVAGVAALMLQANPNLTTQEVRDILTATARADGFTETVPNVAWGHGKVSAHAAVGQAERSGGGCSSSGATTGLLGGWGWLALPGLWRRQRKKRRPRSD